MNAEASGPNRNIAMDITPNEFRRAVYSNLCLSFPGLLAIMSATFDLKSALEIAAAIPVQIIVGYVTMVLIIERVAVPHRDQFQFFCVGVPFAVFLFISGLFAGSALSMILDPSVGLFVDLIWVLLLGSLVGALPAAVFGMIATCMLRKVRNGNPPTEHHLTQP